MSRFRLLPNSAQEAALLQHCAHARFVWNLAVEQHTHWRPGPDTDETVGIDRGVAVSAALSTGELLNCPDLSVKEAERLVRLQRRLARAQPGSNRRKRVKRAIARLRARAADRRKDWVEQKSTDLARRFDRIHVEKLNVAGMTRSARGTADAPGRNVRQKASLNRKILASAWGLLVTRLKHKAPGRVDEVDAAYSSQECSSCGHIAAESRESQARFRCVACGHQALADVNAAININNRGRTTLAARGALQPPGGAVNREPQPDSPAASVGRMGWNPAPSGGEDVKPLLRCRARPPGGGLGGCRAVQDDGRCPTC